jgi:hypothetical protein
VWWLVAEPPRRSQSSIAVLDHRGLSPHDHHGCHLSAAAKIKKAARAHRDEVDEFSSAAVTIETRPAVTTAEPWPARTGASIGADRDDAEMLQRTLPSHSAPTTQNEAQAQARKLTKTPRRGAGPRRMEASAAASPRASAAA